MATNSIGGVIKFHWSGMQFSWDFKSRWIIVMEFWVRRCLNENRMYMTKVDLCWDYAVIPIEIKCVIHNLQATCWTLGGADAGELILGGADAGALGNCEKDLRVTCTRCGLPKESWKSLRKMNLACFKTCILESRILNTRRNTKMKDKTNLLWNISFTLRNTKIKDKLTGY